MSKKYYMKRNTPPDEEDEICFQIDTGEDDEAGKLTINEQTKNKEDEEVNSGGERIPPETRLHALSSAAKAKLVGKFKPPSKRKDAQRAGGGDEQSGKKRRIIKLNSSESVAKEKQDSNTSEPAAGDGSKVIIGGSSEKQPAPQQVPVEQSSANDASAEDGTQPVASSKQRIPKPRKAREAKQKPEVVEKVATAMPAAPQYEGVPFDARYAPYYTNAKYFGQPPTPTACAFPPRHCCHCMYASMAPYSWYGYTHPMGNPMSCASPRFPSSSFVGGTTGSVSFPAASATSVSSSTQSTPGARSPNDGSERSNSQSY